MRSRAKKASSLLLRETKQVCIMKTNIFFEKLNKVCGKLSLATYYATYIELALALFGIIFVKDNIVSRVICGGFSLMCFLIANKYYKDSYLKEILSLKISKKKKEDVKVWGQLQDIELQPKKSHLVVVFSAISGILVAVAMEIIKTLAKDELVPIIKAEESLFIDYFMGILLILIISVCLATAIIRVLRIVKLLMQERYNLILEEDEA